MSAIDETWHADHLFDHKVRLENEEDRESFATFWDENKDNFPRARLAACAPEALRMLLGLEWAGCATNSYYESEFDVCPVCRGLNPEQRDHKPIEDGTCYPPFGHADDCRWVELMKKAGLR